MSPEEMIVRALLDLLKDLMTQDEKFLVTNQSLNSLFSLYEGELTTAIRHNAGVELLEAWKQDVATFRAEWLTSPGGARTMFRDRQVVIVTESATEDAHQKCQDRKKRTGGVPRGQRIR